MKNKRREYTAQFYKKNHIAFAAALLSSLLTSALNLYIAWVLQQMIDAVSGVPGVTGAEVDLAAKSVSFEGQADLAAVKKAVTDAGYEVKD